MKQRQTTSKVRVQQAWEMQSRPGDFRIPVAPVGTRFVKVLPTASWPKVAADDELVSFTIAR